jgi:TetR/AcrR family transcriptional regulator, tetracycline repressor protein
MPLTRAQIAGAALRVADHDGPEAPGIRRVARELGVTPMALYRYVASREDLLEVVRSSLYERLDFDARSDMSWDDELRELARAFRRLVHDHPAAPALLAGASGESEEERRICDLMLGSFRRAGFDAATAEILYLQFSHFVLALVRLDSDRSPRDKDGFELGLDLFLGGVDALRSRR